MINHHPSPQWLASYVAADLPVSLCAAIATHLEFCPECQSQVHQITQTQAKHHFEYREEPELNRSEAAELELMLEQILLDDQPLLQKPASPKSITVAGQSYQLPKALQSLPLGSFLQLGKLSRARVQLQEEPIRSSLLHIKAGGSVPEHSHKGFELTLLLDGYFSDARGQYEPGDFIVLDAQHTHQPLSTDGCLCFTVVSDALRFTQGMNRLLNPIGSFIY